MADNSGQLRFDLGGDPKPVRYEPDPEVVREDALAMLTSARAVTAEAMWDQRTYRYNKVIFPQRPAGCPTRSATSCASNSSASWSGSSG